MKPSLLFTHALSIVSILCTSISVMPMQPSSAETVVQSDAQLSLPEGARARLGKGIISDIAYSNQKRGYRISFQNLQKSPCISIR